MGEEIGKKIGSYLTRIFISLSETIIFEREDPRRYPFKREMVDFLYNYLRGQATVYEAYGLYDLQSYIIYNSRNITIPATLGKIDISTLNYRDDYYLILLSMLSYESRVQIQDKITYIIKGYETELLGNNWKKDIASMTPDEKRLTWIYCMLNKRDLATYYKIKPDLINFELKAVYDSFLPEVKAREVEYVRNLYEPRLEEKKREQAAAAAAEKAAAKAGAIAAFEKFKKEAAEEQLKGKLWETRHIGPMDSEEKRQFAVALLHRRYPERTMQSLYEEYDTIPAVNVDKFVKRQRDYAAPPEPARHVGLNASIYYNAGLGGYRSHSRSHSRRCRKKQKKRRSSKRKTRGH